MYQKILVPLDGSELSERALSHAAQVARGCQARLTLMRCPVETDSLVIQQALTKGPCHAEELREMGRKEAESYLSRVAARPELQELIEEVKTPSGSAPEQILDLAQKDHYDMIILSSHGRGGFERFMFGSVADKVVRHAPCPVLVVGNH